jgi:hypothetical protein
MAYDVKKLWSQKDIEQSIEGWGATDYYSVTGTPTELNDEKNLLLASGLPRIGSSHSTNRTLRLYALQAGPGLAERIISARYQWLPNGLPTNGDADPLTSKPAIRWSRVTRQETLPTDIHGSLITNSAGDPFDPGPQFERMSRLLEIERYERSYQPEIADQFEGTVNAVDMFAGGRRFPRGTILCISIVPSDAYQADAPSVRIVYTFEVRARFFGKPRNAVEAEPFRYWVADRGSRGYASASGGLVDFYEKESDGTIGNQVSNDINLSRGAPIKLTQYFAGANQAAPVAVNKLPTSNAPKYVTLNGVNYIGWEVYPYANLLRLGL